jgi:signal transduction histidine kinase
MLNHLLRRIHPLDAVTAGALCLASQVEVWAPDAMVGTGAVEGSRPLLSATAAVGTLALSIRCVAPVTSGAAVFAAWGVQGLLTTPTQGLVGLICLALAADSFDAHGRPRGAAVAAAVALAAITTISEDGADWTFLTLVVAAAAAAGFALRRRQARIAGLREQAAALVRERDEAVERERSRIAHELHDIVSHHVMTMVVQAEAGRARIGDQDAVKRSLTAIESGGRAALADLRALLGVLRTGEASVGREPPPSLADLPALVDRTRAAGLPVTLEVHGTGRPAAGISLAAYRVVQEALTNILKHVARATASVRVEHEEGGLRVTVSNTGGGRLNGSPASGLGLAGMRERTAAYGGTLAVRDEAGEGFEVDAWFPAEDP